MVYGKLNMTGNQTRERNQEFATDATDPKYP